jgi:OOP family OmpA-OmpF porin
MIVSLYELGHFCLASPRPNSSFLIICMKKCLPFLIVIIGLTLSSQSHAQFGKLKDKIKQKVDQRVDKKENETIDKGLDEVEGSTKKKSSTEEGDIKEKKDGDVSKTKIETKGPGIKAYSKYDFVPGDKIVYAEDFAQDVVGEFPLKWNTNGSGEVVTLEGQPGKWLKMIANTKYTTPYEKKLPDNYTVEFDMILDFKESTRVPDMEFVMFDKRAEKAGYRPEMRMYIGPQSGTYNSGNDQGSIDRFRIVSYDEKSKEYLRSKDQLIGELYNNKAKPVHFALWVQKERVRAWVNQVKIFDLPKALSPALELSALEMVTGSYGANNENYSYYLSNIKVAMANPDTRSKLITEGKWSTTGILFDVNSDKIKPTSYGVLKDIASTLKENPDVKVKIIGHTDSDGDDGKNLDLSKRRAAAVKIVLSSEFGIDASRMETDGAGETKPVGDNKTPEGKATNRRVEFVKL